MSAHAMERQRAWMHALRAPDSMIDGANTATFASIGWYGGIRSREAGFAVYVNNVRATLRDVLAATYPLNKGMIGQQRFDHAAIAMLEQYPPTSADLGEYGERFADVLCAVSAPPIAIDVARCEWLVDQLPRRPAEAAWRIEAAAALSPHDWLSLPLRLVSQCAVLRAVGDLAALFAAKDPTAAAAECDGTTARPHFFCLIAGNDRVAIEPLSAQAHALASMLDGRIGLEAVTEQLLATDPGFEFFPVIASLLAIGAIGVPSLPKRPA